MSNEADTLYCANHPQTPTLLRCSRCEKPICPRCAVQTPTGYRCKDCIRSQQKVFETALPQDYVLGTAVAGALSLLGSLFIPLLSWFTIFLSPIAGVVIAEAARFVTRRRRARMLFIAIAGAAVLGSLPVLLYSLGLLFALLPRSGLAAGSAIYSLIWRVVYTAVIASTVYYRLSGINIR